MAATRNPPIFLDTSAIFALADADDAAHAACLKLYRKVRQFICHDAILLETFSLICKRISKSAAVEVLASVRQSPKIQVTPLGADLLEAGWQRCSRFDDKDWDWIDCLSFELMDRRGLRSALTLDQHFRQAGFTVLA